MSVYCLCGVNVNICGALHCTIRVFGVSVWGWVAAGCRVGVTVFVVECFPHPERLGLGRAAQWPYPIPCRGLNLHQYPIRQPQLAKGGGTLVVFDVFFMGKRASCSRLVPTRLYMYNYTVGAQGLTVRITRDRNTYVINH